MPVHLEEHDVDTHSQNRYWTSGDGKVPVYVTTKCISLLLRTFALLCQLSNNLFGKFRRKLSPIIKIISDFANVFFFVTKRNSDVNATNYRAILEKTLQANPLPTTNRLTASHEWERNCNLFNLVLKFAGSPWWYTAPYKLPFLVSVWQNSNINPPRMCNGTTRLAVRKPMMLNVIEPTILYRKSSPMEKIRSFHTFPLLFPPLHAVWFQTNAVFAHIRVVEFIWRKVNHLKCANLNHKIRVFHTAKLHHGCSRVG